MKFRLAILAVFAGALSACTTATMATNPLQARWNGKSAGTFFAAYGPPISDNGGTQYTWRGGYSSGKRCVVELSVDQNYAIKSIRVITDHVDPKGGPSHCEKVLDAA